MGKSSVSDAHYHVFGYIIHVYAKIENGLRLYLGWRLDIPESHSYLTAIIAAPYTTRDFRNVVKALHKELPMDEPDHSQFLNLLGEFKSLSKLRNHIAHNMWVPGARPDTIKPLFSRISEEKLQVFGAKDEEHDYTVKELYDEAAKLEKLQSQFIQFYRKWGVGAFDDLIFVENSEITKPST